MIESLKFGVLLLIVFAVIHVIMMGVNNDFTMTHPGMFLGVFLSGVIVSAAPSLM